MGLSEQDRSRLHTIEKALRAQYPGLARRLTRDRGSRRWRVAVGLVLLVLVPVGVVVWMLMVGVALLGAVLLVLAVIALGVLTRILE